MSFVTARWKKFLTQWLVDTDMKLGVGGGPALELPARLSDFVSHQKKFAEDARLHLTESWMDSVLDVIQTELSEVFSLGPSDAIVLATDGLWDVTSASAVSRTWANAGVAGRWEDDVRLWQASTTADTLVRSRRSKRDDVAVVIVVPLKPYG